MISRFFIDRPIFAAVLSILITLAGGIAVFTLPLAQFPAITPPTVSVTCTYPGASAKDVAEAVAAPIEQQINGVEGMMYMSSQCTNDGTYNLTVTFNHGVNLNMAQVLVQNRVNLAIPALPDVIKQTGVTVKKRSPDILMGLAITSPTGRYKQLYLSNYALMQIRDELSRVAGVSDVFLFGERDYSMRIWLDPNQLAARNLSASDVVAAIREQNSQVAAGAIGQQPMRAGQQFQVPLTTQGRLKEKEEFENIILKATGGRIAYLKDVARVELAAKDVGVDVKFDGQETIFLAIFQLPDANALDTRDRVLAKMDELGQHFPDGVTYDIAFDTTPYTRESIHEVFNTLRDAVILVAIVVLLFLQNWRSALIPLIAVPVAIVGTFAAMAAFGFSLNNLTLFGLVLAIGIVVDDAIVVVEAVEHHIELGLAPREATIEAMRQVSGPVIAVGLVLSAVFLPCMFMAGITGQFFRQFALTISVSTVISAFNSLTLSPALTALLLRRHDKNAVPPLPWLAFPLGAAGAAYLWLTPHLHAPLEWLAERLPASRGAALHEASTWLAPTLAMLAGATLGALAGRRLNSLLRWFFGLFNRGFVRVTSVYTRTVSMMMRLSVVVLLVYAGLLALTSWRFSETPRGFIPSQDMGYLLVNVQLPDAASMERTQAVMNRLVTIARQTPGIKHATAISGQSFVLNAYGSNFGSMFVNLKDYPDRRDPSLSSDAIAARLRGAFDKEVLEAQVGVFGPPPVRGVGRSGGFTIMIEDRGDLGPKVLQEQTENLVRKGNSMTVNNLARWDTAKKDEDKGSPASLIGLMTVFRANVPQLHIAADPGIVSARGVRVQDLSDTLTVYEGSLYVNDFNLFGRTWQVIVQADQQFRTSPEQLPGLKVRNARGGMVPLGSLGSMKEVNGPLVLTRYNMHPAASISGGGAPGVSSGQALALMQKLADEELPNSMGYEWTDMSYLELIAGNKAMILFACAVAMVFLVLAAQYESWSLPLAIILVVPMCLLSAITGVNIAKMDNNIFTQIGFVVLVGLASKNAILIVEFAKHKREAGESRIDAALAARKLRLRPIVMTSLAFILGVVPLVLATGAGAEMRRTLGTAVFGGMIGVTLFGIFLTPVFFVTIDWLGHTRLFTSPLMRRTRAVSLDLLTLKPLRQVSGHLWRYATTARRRPRSGETIKHP